MVKRFSATSHWRDSSRPVRFFMVDYRAAFPLLFCLMHIRIWTFTVALLAMTFFSLIERRGFTVVVFMRWLRSTAAGSRRVAIPWWRR